MRKVIKVIILILRLEKRKIILLIVIKYRTEGASEQFKKKKNSR